jgi:hypothetical protein
MCQMRDLAVSANEWRTGRNRTVLARIKAEFSSLPSLTNFVDIVNLIRGIRNLRGE